MHRQEPAGVDCPRNEGQGITKMPGLRLLSVVGQ